MLRLSSKRLLQSGCVPKKGILFISNWCLRTLWPKQQHIRRDTCAQLLQRRSGQPQCTTHLELTRHPLRLAAFSPSPSRSTNMTQCSLVFVSFLVGCAAAACSGTTGYEGDGRFIDRGSSAAIDRYILDLGPVDLTRTSTSKFQVANLPGEEFVAGLQLTPAAGVESLEKASVTATVSLRIVDQQGKVIVNVSGPLRDWTWSTARNTSAVFAYGGYGAMASFMPARRGTYTVTFTILQPDQSERHGDARLLLKGGGWK